MEGEEPMIVGVVKEIYPGERRVALVPGVVPALTKAGLEILVEAGAGEAAGYPDGEYRDKGARLASGRAEVFGRAGILIQVRTPVAGRGTGQDDIPLLRSGQTLIGLADPLGTPEAAAELARRGVTLLALELIPRISRAQSMDVLSSMATVAGYRAVLLAAVALPRMFPMLMTAAGTISPARVLVIGAGVAGLQAIATARRLGARVEAYDVRPAVKEQVESLGARFVDLGLETAAAEDRGGYARAQGEEFYDRQRQAMGRIVAASDAVITTAAIPGKKAPVLITAEMVAGMAPGSVIVDLAAERGGNCELTRADEMVVENGVTILGPTNLPSEAPYHASQMYARNASAFLLHLWREGRLVLDSEDPIAAETLVTRGGEVVHSRVREALGLVAAPAGKPA